ncbi:MAG: RHS repeat-associated core domain-containing protein [Planctomycetota bacterium]
MTSPTSYISRASVLIPALICLALGAGAWLLPAAEPAPPLVANGLDANPGASGPDDECPPGASGGQGDAPPPAQADPCPVQVSIGGPEVVPMPWCVERGEVPFISKAAGASNQANTFGPYDPDPVRGIDNSVYSNTPDGDPPIDSPFIDAVTGNLTVVDSDLSLVGKYFDFNLVRTYRSNNDQYEGVAGLGWEINTNRSIEVTAHNQSDEPTAFAMASGSGLGTESFTRNTNSDWFSGSRGGVAKYDNTDKISVYNSSGIEEQFEPYGGNVWYLPTSVTDTWGQSTSISHKYFPQHPAGYIVDTITDDIGRTLVYSYHAGNGRLAKVEINNAASSLIAQIEYSYEERSNGQVTLTKVEGLEIATEDSIDPTQIDFVREVVEYDYQYILIDSGTNPDTYAWLLKSIKNGNGEIEYEWTYDSDSGGQVTTQKDRPGSTVRPDGEGVHSYIYSAGYTDYLGPDGEHREFHYDSNGRIEKRRDEIDSVNNVWREILFTYNDPNCTSCEILTDVTYPDGSKEHMQYDSEGNLTTKWWYPPTGSSAPNRVERWAYEKFDPKGGEMRTRLLEHELRRDAHPNEDPDNTCNHPSCDEAQNVDGHIVHLYEWSQDGLELESIDYGSIQSSTGASPGQIHREEHFDYFLNDGRLSGIHQLEDSAEQTKWEFTLSTSGNYISKETQTDPINTKTWETDFVVNEDFMHLTEVTGSDNVTTAYLMDDSGRIYWIGEDYSSPTAARNNDIRYDKAGRMVKLTTSGGTLTEVRELDLDENGFPYESHYTGPGAASAVTTEIEFSAGGRIEKRTDWRNWSTEWIYGEGAFMLLSEIKESFATKTRTVWSAGIGGSGGYDEMGRLLSWENAENWEYHNQYDDHGRLKKSFAETSTGYYAARDRKYDARGFLKEVEVGAIQGSPSSISSQKWLEHHVLTHNLAGHLLSWAVYESGAVDEARMTKYIIDGRGRAVRETEFMGDRTLGLSSATGVVEEFTYDARDRILHQELLTSGVGSLAVKEVFFDHLDGTREMVAERISSQGTATKLVEKVKTKFDKLGRPEESTQYEWSVGTGMYTGNTRTWKMGFDELDRYVSYEDPLSVGKEWTYDELNRLEAVSRVGDTGAKQTTTYAYDSTHGYLKSATDAKNKVTNYTVYTADWLRPDKVTYPDGRWLQNTTFDDLDRVRGTLDSRGITHTYTYKESHSLRNLRSDDTNVQSLTNVIGDDKLVWSYDPWLDSMSQSEVWRGGSKVWETQFSYNDLGERTGEVQGPSGQDETWAWAFGYNGELRSTTYPSGLGLDVSALTYDGAGRLGTATYKKGATTVANYTLSHYGTRVSNRSDSIASLDADYGFDGYGRWTSATWSSHTGSTPVTLEGDERVIDKAGRVTSRQRVMDSVGDAFVHDEFGRMSEWYSGVPNANGGGAISVYSEKETYHLNDVYARTAVDFHVYGSSTTTTQSYTTNNAHFYTNVGGNARTETDGYLNSDGTHYYRWDAWGKLVEVEEISTTNVIRMHEYDAEGRRVRSTDGSSVTTRFVYDWADLAASYEEGTTPSNVRTYGLMLGGDDETLVVVENAGAANGTYELARDFQGSILGLIDRSNNTVVERYRYTPFGAVSIEDGSGNALTTSAYGNDRFFMGRVFDADLGIYDVRNRWFDPETGAFLSPDPLLALDSWNMYQYGFGAPITWMDPYGLENGSTQGPGGTTTYPADFIGPLPEGGAYEPSIAEKVADAIDAVANGRSAGDAVDHFGWNDGVKYKGRKYIYFKSGVVIDLKHFFTAAEVTCWVRFQWITLASGFGYEYLQGLSPYKKDRDSAHPLGGNEDMESNGAGAEFAAEDWDRNADNIGDLVVDFLIDKYGPIDDAGPNGPTPEYDHGNEGPYRLTPEQERLIDDYNSTVKNPRYLIY